MFRQDPSGATVFFPWGVAYRGYRLPDEVAKRRALKAVSMLTASTVAVGVWTAHLLQPLVGSDPPPFGETAQTLAAPLGCLGAALLAYYTWMVRCIESLPESGLQVSKEEQLRQAAKLGVPRKIGVIGVTLTGLSGLLCWIRPEAWWMGVIGVACGLGLIAWAMRIAHYR